MRNALSPKEHGISLIELVIAIIILSIGTLAAIRVNETVHRGVGEQEARLLAQQVALNRASKLKFVGMAAGRALPTTVEMGRVQWQVAVVENATRIGLIEATIVVTGKNLPGARLVTFVPVHDAP